ncbi:Csu type fimbrial protein [Halomonas maura]|uniref:Csu type fimbrial protein n=1 Tax=Halomonas maura TaxID=117606 RepID=UPI0025B4455D|nr:spore coat U domain-containing protein [Halomonas maura]MDN3556609.1 spore coat U domain-containing protein [Halomonas maura]
MNRIQALQATLIALALFGTAVHAQQTSTTTFLVSATVNDTCEIAATDLAFGTYDPNAADDMDGTSTVTATCTSGTNYDIGLDTGQNTPSTTTRAMSDGVTNTLDYELYSDSARTTVWGNTVGDDTLNVTSAGGAENHTVYGQIPAGQFEPAGSYSDTINVTVTY